MTPNKNLENEENISLEEGVDAPVGDDVDGAGKPGIGRQLKESGGKIARDGVDSFLETLRETGDIDQAANDAFDKVADSAKQMFDESALGKIVNGKVGDITKRAFNNDVGIDDALDVLDDLHPLFRLGHRFLDSMRPESCRTLTYGALIGEVLKNRPADPAVAGCCVLKETVGSNIRIIVLYIDRQDEPVFGNDIPYGFYLLTKEFDDELTEAFGDTDMLVIK
ncbi:MAG: hypothetical protein MJ016_03545 [Victivallaceae bacterium]|nr:hypothetical protein [Victivallaceae bacterium]